MEGVLAGNRVVGLEVPSEYHFIVKQWLNKKLQLLLLLSLKGVGIALATAWLSSKPPDISWV